MSFPVDPGGSWVASYDLASGDPELKLPGLWDFVVGAWPANPGLVEKGMEKHLKRLHPASLE